MREGQTPFLLHGVNLAAYSDEENDPVQHALAASDEEDYRAIADAGFNCVRLNLWSKAFAASPQTWQWLDLHLAWACAHGLRVILDLHAPPGGFHGPGAQGHAFFRNTPWQNAAIAFWKAAATRYRNCSTVAALDLLNEPRPRQDRQWWDWVRRAIPAIRAAGWQGPIIVEQSFASGASLQKLSDPGILYDVHFYEPWSFCSGSGGQYGAPAIDPWFGGQTLNRALLLRLFQEELLAFSAQHEVPVNVGEFGIIGKMLPNGAAEWLTDVLEILNQYGVHRQYWCWHTYAFGLHDTQWHRTDPPQGTPALLQLLSAKAPN